MGYLQSEFYLGVLNQTQEMIQNVNAFLFCFLF